MSAQSARLNTTASNLANVDTGASSPEKAYHAKQTVFETYLGNAEQQLGRGRDAGSGVRVADVIESDAPLRIQYEPGNPQANDEGYVFYSNVNLVKEMANMMSSSRSFQSNTEVINTAKTLMLKTLQILCNIRN